MATLGSAGLGRRIAIVGAGPLGLIATKNFVEEGFQVTTFERTDNVGGLWRQTCNPQRTSVLPGTVTNTSKYTGAMTDYPMPDSYPIYPDAEQIRAYFEAYARDFDLNKHIRFCTEVVGIEHDKASNIWRVTVRSSDDTDGQVERRTFDRLIVATGSFQKALVPDIKGIDDFQGEIVHSQAFKDPARYKDKTILVVGLGNTSADSISAFLHVGVKRLIVSHRHKIVILPRITKDNKILEFTLTYRLILLIFWVQKISEALAATIMANELQKIQNDNFPGLQSHRAFASDRQLPAPKNLLPVISDDLAGHFLNGRLESATGISEIRGPNTVRFVDGTEVNDVDVILLCTGLQPDLAAMVPCEFDPYNADLAPEVFGELPLRYTENRRVARLYQGFVSLQSPHSLAFLGACLAKRPAFQLYDLMTMALAQLWGGKYPMPSQRQMERNADAHIHHLARLTQSGDVKLTGVMGGFEFDRWMNEVAGTGLYTHLDDWISLKCWGLWWSDRKLYRVLVSGIRSTHVLRLFGTERGRKAWPGARRAILVANDGAVNWTSPSRKEAGLL